MPAQLVELCPGLEPTGMTPEAWATLRELGRGEQLKFLLGYVKDKWATAYAECQERHKGLVQWTLDGGVE